MGATKKHPPKGAAKMIQELAASGHTQLGIASKLGVAISTFRRWIEEDELLHDAYDLGKETERQALHAMVVESARAGKPANVNAFFILKARHGYVEADQKSSNSVNIAVVAQNVMVVKDSGDDAEWAAKVASQQQRLVVESAHTPRAIAPEASQPTPSLAIEDTPGMAAPSPYEDQPPSWVSNA